MTRVLLPLIGLLLAFSAAHANMQGEQARLPDCYKFDGYDPICGYGCIKIPGYDPVCSKIAWGTCYKFDGYDPICGVNCRKFPGYDPICAIPDSKK